MIPTKITSILTFGVLFTFALCSTSQASVFRIKQTKTKHHISKQTQLPAPPLVTSNSCSMIKTRPLKIEATVAKIKISPTRQPVTPMPFTDRRTPSQSVGKIKTTNILKEHFAKWEGTRYRKGGFSPRGVDCSGFTSLTYKEVFGRSLPRSSVEQAQGGQRIARSNLRPGDLVFFKRGVYGKHVGIYLENGKFIHASTTKGVTISHLSDAYWRNKYWTAARY